jgi:hypothetical protein
MLATTSGGPTEQKDSQYQPFQGHGVAPGRPGLSFLS